MKAKWIPSSAARVILLGALAIRGHAQMGRPGSPGFSPLESQMNTIFTDAGFRPNDEVSLIQALKHDDPRIAVWAAELLTRLPATASGIAALEAAAQGQSHTVTVGAFRALAKLKATGWEVGASRRLLSLRHLDEKLAVAGSLARAGRADGWDIVQGALFNENETTVISALIQATDFDGLTDQSGKPINVAEKLDAVLSNFPRQRQQIEAKRDQLMKNKR